MLKVLIQMLLITHQVKIPAAIDQIFFPVKFYFDIVLIQNGIQFRNFLENFFDLQLLFVGVFFVVIHQVVNDYLEFF